MHNHREGRNSTIKPSNISPKTGAAELQLFLVLRNPVKPIGGGLYLGEIKMLQVYWDPWVEQKSYSLRSSGYYSQIPK